MYNLNFFLKKKYNLNRVIMIVFNCIRAYAQNALFIIVEILY